jgi:hypothetical protein
MVYPSACWASQAELEPHRLRIRTLASSGARAGCITLQKETTASVLQRI